MTPVWVAKQDDGSFNVALFNLNAFPTPVSIDWNTIGFLTSPNVRDLWSHTDLGGFDQGFRTVVLGHSARLLKVESKGVVAPAGTARYEAEFGLAQGSTQFLACKPCSDGNKVVKLGLGIENTLTLNNIYTERAGIYRVEIDPVASGSSDLIFQVNDGEPQALKVSGGSANQPSSSFLPLELKTGYNSIRFGNASGVAPDLDRISVGSGSLVGSPSSRSYEAELARLSGTETASSCLMCSGGAQVSSIEQNDENAVTFPNVNAPSGGVYELEIDFVTASQHSVLLTINGGKEINIDLNGSSKVTPSTTVVPVVLKDGKNELRFTSHDFDAPALDRIAVPPPIGSSSLVASLVGKNGPENDRVWTLQIVNSGYQTALNPQINILARTQSSGKETCQPKVLSALPLMAGSIPQHGQLTVPVHLDFSKCSDDAQFNTLIVYSANNGAIVADSAGVSVPQ
ncbi:CBM35 domain-containing protein [Granulicella tundricola]|uniref:CBM35 domain-containing protein n=1 Tax=Granulicella tundricola TaxID=940615 RepID=UPI0001DB7F4E|nr:CBM35 domain-containing protein [Granulicella tundricola]